MKGRPLLIFFLIGIVLAGLFALGYLPRAAKSRAVIASTQQIQSEAPEVTTVPVKLAPSETQLNLSGSIQAVTEAGLYARTDGYVKRRIADIGDRVKRGEVLLELESPEMDQQILQAQAAVNQAKAALAQAEANREQTRANLALSKTTLGRWRQLVAEGVMSKQEGDEKAAEVEAREADVSAGQARIKAAQDAIAAAEANVARLNEIRSFQTLRAPYDGVITQRNVVLGTLVSAGSSTAIRELYRITQLDPLKVMIPVPQNFVPQIRIGMECLIEVQELGNKPFSARVTRTANSLDMTSRTMLTEVQFNNPRGEVYPGMYAKLRFVSARSNPPLLIPSDAIMTGPAGATVAYLRGNNVARFGRVRLGRDDGANTEVLEGLRIGDLVILNPPDEIKDGTKVDNKRTKSD